MPTYLRAKTPVEGWARAVERIMKRGMKRVDERGSSTRWLDNVMIHVEDPFTDRVTDKYPFSEKVLKEKYSTQLLSKERLGFDYTYGERLNAWGTEQVNQMNYIISKLKENQHSRRAVATTWDPRVDSSREEVPCLNHFVFMTREDVLDLSVTIRSNDMYGAWLANVYALAELLKNVCEKVSIATGAVTTISVNAHIYDHDWLKASQL